MLLWPPLAAARGVAALPDLPLPPEVDAPDGAPGWSSSGLKPLCANLRNT